MHYLRSVAARSPTPPPPGTCPAAFAILQPQSAISNHIGVLALGRHATTLVFNPLDWCAALHRRRYSTYDKFRTLQKQLHQGTNGFNWSQTQLHSRSYRSLSSICTGMEQKNRLLPIPALIRQIYAPQGREYYSRIATHNCALHPSSTSGGRGTAWQLARLTRSRTSLIA